ncbi:MAG: TetR/AcrR family transcriptional regulator [Deltaproteobacteria bacterium]|nr:TetR/AcrR family transcriptional regulator [Deltaproteobacteria bacterium]
MTGPADDDRRRAILDSAARLFGHYGHAKTTIADIAREAGIGVGSVYLVFDSKEAIVEELSMGAHVRVLSAMRAVATDRAHETFPERLAGVLEARVTAFQDLGRSGQHACDLLHCKSSPVKTAHARFREEEHALLCALFEDAKKTGEISTIDPTRAASLVQRAFATLTPPWLYEEPLEEARRTAHDLSRLLLLGLVARGEALRTSSRAKKRR